MIYQVGQKGYTPSEAEARHFRNLTKRANRKIAFAFNTGQEEYLPYDLKDSKNWRTSKTYLSSSLSFASREDFVEATKQRYVVLTQIQSDEEVKNYLLKALDSILTNFNYSDSEVFELLNYVRSKPSKGLASVRYMVNTLLEVLTGELETYYGEDGTKKTGRSFEGAKKAIDHLFNKLNQLKQT